MKLFANTRDWAELSDFEPYIGKDVWISCVLPNNEPGYIRILDVVGDMLECNVYMDTSLWRDNKRYLYTHRVYPHNLRLSRPIEVIDSAELIPDDADNSTISINKFIGRPYWIKCYFDLDAHSAINYYVNILSADEFTLRARFIEAWYVEDYDPESTSGLPSDHLKGPKVIPTAALSVCDPLEVLTDEELHIMLEDNDAAHSAAGRDEDAYWEDDDE